MKFKYGNSVSVTPVKERGAVCSSVSVLLFPIVSFVHGNQSHVSHLVSHKMSVTCPRMSEIFIYNFVTAILFCSFRRKI